MRLEWTNGKEGKASGLKTQTKTFELCYTFVVGGPDHPSLIGDIRMDRLKFPRKGSMVFEGSPAIVTEINWEMLHDGSESLRVQYVRASLPPPALPPPDIAPPPGLSPPE